MKKIRELLIMFSVIMMTFTFSVPVRAYAPSVNYGKKIKICPWENILVTDLPYNNKIKSTKLLSNSNKKVVEVVTECGQVWLKAKKPGTSEVKVLLRLKNGKKKKVRFTVKNVRNVFPFKYLKINNKKLKPKYSKMATYETHWGYMYDSIKKTNKKLTLHYKLKKGWKIKSMEQFWVVDKESERSKSSIVKNGSALKFGEPGGGFVVTAYNKKLKRTVSYTIVIRAK